MKRSALRKTLGLTLIELLVVLLILAVLTTVAMQSTESMVHQARREATENTLENLQRAVVGDQEEPNVASGFLADIGRPPLLDGDGQPSELWQVGTLPPYTISASTLDPDVLLGAGWQGPYLNLPLGETALRDGWANPFNFNPVSGNPILETAVSWGLYNTADTSTANVDAYEDDVGIFFKPSPNDFHNEYDNIEISGTITGNILLLDGAGNEQEFAVENTAAVVWFHVFGPNPDMNSTDLVNFPPVGHSAAIEVATYDGMGPVPTSVQPFTFPTTAGRKAIRAYWNTATDAPAIDVNTLRSRVFYVTVPAGATVQRDLTIFTNSP